MFTDYEARVLQRNAAPPATARRSNVSPIRHSGSRKPRAGTFSKTPIGDDQSAFARLTTRQLEVLELLCEGLSNKHIARRLDISVGTVKIHVGCIIRELRVQNRLQAVVTAQRLGLDTRAGSLKPRERGDEVCQHMLFTPRAA